jgi:hypothetical protein
MDPCPAQNPPFGQSSSGKHSPHKPGRMDKRGGHHIWNEKVTSSFWPRMPFASGALGWALKRGRRHGLAGHHLRPPHASGAAPPRRRLPPQASGHTTATFPALPPYAGRGRRRGRHAGRGGARAAPAALARRHRSRHPMPRLGPRPPPCGPCPAAPRTGAPPLVPNACAGSGTGHTALLQVQV